MPGPTPRYTLRQETATDPFSWAPYDKQWDQFIRPAQLGKLDAAILTDRLNTGDVDWIPAAERRQSAWWPVDRNDGHYPDDSEVWVLYPGPGDDEHDRDTWHWHTGYILGQVAADEWEVAVDDDRVLEDPGQDWVPACLRDSSEIRPRRWAGDAAAAGYPPHPRRPAGPAAADAPARHHQPGTAT
ncbi:hypothetical protein [Kribbella sp. NPDC048928]|uniref:hypothetical protein n=1 Tax=Kribbella sp. NPDC048928 TaxID=3364111 RepID=UPI00371729D5